MTWILGHISQRSNTNPAVTRRNNNIIITSKRRRNVVWRNNDAIITSSVRWEYLSPLHDIYWWHQVTILHMSRWHVHICDQIMSFEIFVKSFLVGLINIQTQFAARMNEYSKGATRTNTHTSPPAGLCKMNMSIQDRIRFVCCKWYWYLITLSSG